MTDRSLADMIIEWGPFVAGDMMPFPVNPAGHPLIAATDMNALRDELIAARRASEGLELTESARREMAQLERVSADVRGTPTARAKALLTIHQRRDIGSCLCGWAELGKSHAGHQAAMLDQAGLLG